MLQLNDLRSYGAITESEGVALTGFSSRFDGKRKQGSKEVDVGRKCEETAKLRSVTELRSKIHKTG